MTQPDPLSYLQTLLSRDFESERYAHSRKPHVEAEPLIITLSRDYGALGEDVARLLSQCLGIPLYDREILEKVAQRAKTDKFFFETHDEQVAAGLSSFLYSLISGSTATLADYRRNLFNVVLDLAHKDCLLVGRGAHLILTGKKVFRVRIVGSKRVCAQRIAEASKMSILEAEHKVFEINNKRHQSVLNLYSENFEHCSLELAKNFDLVINTDHISAEGAMPVILLAMQQAGFDLSRSKKAS